MRFISLAPAFLALSLCGVDGADLRLIEIDPGHSHAAALHAHMLPGFSPEAHIYAPLGPDLTAHLERISRFNNRADDPTHWALSIFAGPDFLQKLKEEPPGNVVVLAGRNDKKMDYIRLALRSGQNVLADKPWIIEPEQLQSLEAALDLADQKHLIAYDCMTMRYEFAYQVAKDFLGDREIFGQPVTGTADAPAVRLENLHALLKGGALRPPWYFDIHVQGEAIADVGTHLVDFAEWALFPNEAIDYRKDVRVLSARHWPLTLTAEEFERVTGDKPWPSYLKGAVGDGKLEYLTNGEATFSIRGINIWLRSRWEYEAAPNSRDSYFTSFQGSKSRVEVRAGPDQHYVPEVFIFPAKGANSAQVLVGLRERYPRFQFEPQQDGGIHVVISSLDRKRGADSYGLLVDRFLSYVRNPRSLPPWEKPNMIAKYYITTTAVRMARAHSK
jgi:predicted dehydrogenase